MLKRFAILVIATALPSASVMAADISGCINSCESIRMRNKQSCMNYYSDQSRYTACLSDADRTYQQCTGRCYL